MRRPSSGAALAAGGLAAAVGTALITVGGFELAGQPRADIWSNSWIFTGLVVVGLGVLAAAVFVMMDFSAGGARPTP